MEPWEIKFPDTVYLNSHLQTLYSSDSRDVKGSSVIRFAQYNVPFLSVTVYVLCHRTVRNGMPNCSKQQNTRCLTIISINISILSTAFTNCFETFGWRLEMRQGQPERTKEIYNRAARYSWDKSGIYTISYDHAKAVVVNPLKVRIHSFTNCHISLHYLQIK